MARQRNSSVVGTLDNVPETPAAPQVEAPQVEAPQVEAPQVEAPQVDPLAALAANLAPVAVATVGKGKRPSILSAAARTKTAKLLTTEARIDASKTWCRDKGRSTAVLNAILATVPDAEREAVSDAFWSSSWKAVYADCAALPVGEGRDNVAKALAAYIAQHGMAFAECKEAATQAALKVAAGDFAAGAAYWTSTY